MELLYQSKAITKLTKSMQIPNLYMNRAQRTTTSLNIPLFFDIMLSKKLLVPINELTHRMPTIF